MSDIANTLRHESRTAALTKVNNHRLLLAGRSVTRRVLLLAMREEPKSTRARFGPGNVDHGRSIIIAAVSYVGGACNTSTRATMTADFQRENAAVVRKRRRAEPHSVVATALAALVVCNRGGGLGGKHGVRHAASWARHIEHCECRAEDARLLTPSILARWQRLEARQHHDLDGEAHHEYGQGGGKAHARMWA